jgi:hypothetical protein
MRFRVCLPSIILLVVVLSYGTPVHSAMTGKEFLQDTQSYQNGFINGLVSFKCVGTGRVFENVNRRNYHRHAMSREPT